MLRRKLLVVLGMVVLMLMALAIAAIVLMQRVLQDLDHLNDAAVGLLAPMNELGAAVTVVENELDQLRSGQERHLDDLIMAGERINALAARIRDHYVLRGEAGESFSRFQELLPEFERHIGAIATVRDEGQVRDHSTRARTVSVAMREQLTIMSQICNEHFRREQEAVTTQFRWIVVGLAIVFVLGLNITVGVLIRASRMVLRPIDELVRATERLAREEFSHRVRLEQHDEFDKLAQAYNDMAAQLELNEERRIEAIGHVAATLNHELNNGLAIIEAQIALLGRQSNDNEALERRLKQIRDNLHRMAETVAALRRIRRIVLTDYAAGEQMLDLARSTGETAPDGPGDDEPS